MKVCDIVELCKKYGRNTTLGDLVLQIQGRKIYKCPKCRGTGFIEVKYNAYPSGLPDSGFACDWRIRHDECDLCNGEGYTEHEYKPKMVQDGWE